MKKPGTQQQHGNKPTAFFAWEDVFSDTSSLFLILNGVYSLEQMDIERERGITIKLQTARYTKESRHTFLTMP
jgi:hypothetical protein